MARTETWTLSPAAATLLFAESGLGALPQPFEPHHPYTTVAARDAYRARTYRELADSGWLVDGRLRPAAERMLSCLAGGPQAVLVMAVVDDGVLLARAARDMSTAVLARQRGERLMLAAIEPAALVRSTVALVPDAPAAVGSSVTIPADADPPQTGEVEDIEAAEAAVFNDDAELVHAHRDAGAAAMFSEPTVRSGAFVPVVDGRQQPPVTWFDTRAESDGSRGRDGADADVVRRFTTTRVHADGSRWTTYVPGDNSRMAAAIAEVLDTGVNGGRRGGGPER